MVRVIVRIGVGVRVGLVVNDTVIASTALIVGDAPIVGYLTKLGRSCRNEPLLVQNFHRVLLQLTGDYLTTDYANRLH